MSETPHEAWIAALQRGFTSEFWNLP